MLPKLDSTLFDWLTWRASTFIELEVYCRYVDITSHRGKWLLRKHAIGWCRGENLLCRPKVGHVAIMCFKNGNHLWFHLGNKEFREVFGL